MFDSKTPQVITRPPATQRKPTEHYIALALAVLDTSDQDAVEGALADLFTLYRRCVDEHKTTKTLRAWLCEVMA